MLDQSISIAEPTLPGKAEAASVTGFKFPRRPFKVALASGVLIAGGIGVFSEHSTISTSDAIISTYVLSVRTPVEGTVAGLPIASGITVRRGESLGQIDNPLVDHQHLDNLRSVESQNQATAEAVGAEQRILAIQQDGMLDRSRRHVAVLKERLQRELTEAEQVLSAREVEHEQAKAESGRAKKLNSLGVISQATVEKLTSTEQIAARQMAAEEARVDSVRLQLAAAERGDLVEPGQNSEVPYSQQRADEIAMRLADNQRVLSASRFQAREASRQIAEETERAQMREHLGMTSPIDGMIWKLNAVNGEHAAAGDTVISIVDCNRQFILAEIPQNRLPDVAIYQKATFRLAGEVSERTGTVLSVAGDSLRNQESKLASLPLRDPKKELALVLIGLDTVPGRSECLVGRNARVLIPTNPNTSLVSWFRGYF